jgi:hypothetical protein
MKRWLTRMALELIGQSGLGHSFDTLTDDSVVHPFAVAVENLTWVPIHKATREVEN